MINIGKGKIKVMKPVVRVICANNIDFTIRQLAF